MALELELLVDDKAIRATEKKLDEFVNKISKGVELKVVEPKGGQATKAGLKQLKDAMEAVRGMETPLPFYNNLAQLEAVTRTLTKTVQASINTIKLHRVAVTADADAMFKQKKAAIEAKASVTNYNSAANQGIIVSTRQLAALKAQTEAEAMLTQAYRTATYEELRAIAGKEKATTASMEANRAVLLQTETEKLRQKLLRESIRLDAEAALKKDGTIKGERELTEAEKLEAAVLVQLNKLEKERINLLAASDPKVRALKASVDALRSSEEKAAAATTKRSSSLKVGNQATTSFRATLQGLQANMGIYTSSTIVAAAASYQLARSIKDTIKTGMEYSLEMSRVGAVMNASSREMSVLDAEVKRLGASTQLTSSQVAEGLRELGMAGLSAAESYASLEGVLKLSIIGMMDFGQAADIATNIMTGFSLEATDMQRIVDVMAKAVTDSNMTIQQMGNALSYAAPIAEAYGVSLESASAALEVLANAGIKASRGGTTLRRVIDSLYTPTKKGAEALGKMGVTTKNIDGSMRDFVDVLEDIAKSTEGASKNIQYLQDIVEIRALPGFIRLVKEAGNVDEGLRQVRNTLLAASGAADIMATKIADNLVGDLKQLQSAAEAIQLKIFADADAPLRKFVQTLTEALRWMLKHPEAIKQITDAALELAKVIGILIGASAFGGLLKMFANVGRFIGDFAGAIVRGVTAVRTMAPALNAAGAAATGLGGAFQIAKGGALAFLRALGPVGFAITAVGAGLWWLYDNFESVRKLFGDTLPQAMEEGAASVEKFNTAVRNTATVNGAVHKDLLILAKAYHEMPATLEEQRKKVAELKDEYDRLVESAKLLGGSEAAVDMVSEVGDLYEEANKKLIKTELSHQAIAVLIEKEKVKVLELAHAEAERAEAVIAGALAWAQVSQYEAIAEGDLALAENLGVAIGQIGNQWRIAKDASTQAYFAMDAQKVIADEQEAKLQGMNEKAKKLLETQNMQRKGGEEYLDQQRKEMDNNQRMLGMTKEQIAIERKAKAEQHLLELEDAVLAARKAGDKQKELAAVEAYNAAYKEYEGIISKANDTIESGLRAEKKEREAINRVILEQLRLVNDVAKTSRTVEEQLDISDYSGLADTLAASKSKLASVYTQFKKTAKGFKEGSVSVQEMKESLEELTFWSEKYADEDALDEHLKDLAAGFDPVFAAHEEYVKKMEDLEKVRKSGKVSVDALADAQERLRWEEEKAANSTNKMTATLYEWADAARNLDVIGAQWMERFADSVADWASGAKGSFKDFFSYVKRSLIELTTRNFIVNVAGAFGFGPGTANYGMSGIPFGAGGAGGVAQTASNAAGSLSLLDKIATGFGSTLGKIGTGLGGLFSGTSFGFGAAGAGEALAAGTYFSSFGATTAGAAALGGSSIGAAIGYAMPIILPAVAAFMAFGGFDKLFGDKTDPRIQMIAQPGRTSPAGFEDNVYVKTAFVDIGFGGKSHGVKAAEFKEFFETFKGLDETIALAMGETTVGKVKDAIEASWRGEKGIYLDLGQIDIEGKSEAEISQAIGNMAKNYYVQLFKVGEQTGDLFSKVMMKEMEGISGDFEEVMTAITEKVGVLGESFKILNDYIDSDLVVDYSKQVQLANETLWQTGQRLRTEIAAAIAGFDGSADAIQKLAALTADRYAWELQMLAQIHNAMREIASTAASLAEQINLDVMADQEKYYYYKQLAEQAALELASATDPAKIEELSKKALDYAGKAWGLLPEEMKMSLREGFLGFIESVVSVANERLGSAEVTTLQESESIRANIAALMERDQERSDSTNQRLDQINYQLGIVAARNQELIDRFGAASTVDQAQQQYQISLQEQIARNTGIGTPSYAPFSLSSY